MNKYASELPYMNQYVYDSADFAFISVQPLYLLKLQRNSC